MAQNVSKYEQLRDEHPVFIYREFRTEETAEELHVTYRFEVPGLAVFEPEWRFPKRSGESLLTGEDPLLNEMLFSLGMVELISYWKTCCPPKVVVEVGKLTDGQKRWWKEQYFHGLGEFFYTNGIPLDAEGFMTVECAGAGGQSETGAASTAEARQEKPPVAGISAKTGIFTETGISAKTLTADADISGKSLSGYLIPVGGGKDSSVTMDLLKEYKGESFCYMINGRGATMDSAAAAGFGADRIVLAKRTLDARMLELNREGYLNGHTPFSAIVAFSSILAAWIYGLKYVALSNESSANESTVAGSTVNHQYSKSFKFEQDFTDYEKKYIGSGVEYFSLLRPWSEYQIAAWFAGLPQFHEVFRSCNVGSKTDSWCGHCPKCLFVCLILSPFLRPEKIRHIFGRDMLADQEMIPLMEQLIGVTEEKPFECVGSRDEINTAICQTIAQMEEEGMELPLLFSHYLTTEQYQEFKEKENPYLTYFEEENLVPEHLQGRLRGIDWSGMSWRH